VRRGVAITLVLAGLCAPGAAAAARAKDGPAPCSSGDPPHPYHGRCATYSGLNTWYGSHGLGFPSPLGWGLCAVRAGSGGDYPSPSYAYTLTSAPSGSDTSKMNALGWALSDAHRQGWWEWGHSGSFSAIDVAVAAKLYYDHLVWGEKLPSLDAATTHALNALQALEETATGMTGPPIVTLALNGGGTTIETTGAINVAIAAPGSGKGIPGQVVTLTLSGATFNANHSTSANVMTNSAGFASAGFTTDSLNPSKVTATSTVTLAQPGLLFYGPTRIILNAQTITGPHAPVSHKSTLTLTATGAPRGRVQVHKAGDDEPYLPVAGAVFQVIDGAGDVMDTLVTDASGLTQVSGPLLTGTYTVHEEAPPPGYAAGSDVTATVSANATTLVEVGPSDGDLAIRGSVTVTKLDAETATPLSGAVFSVTYDPSDHLRADGPTTTCTTGTDGTCTFEDLLPGHYEFDEISPPANYLPLDPDQWLYVGPGEQLGLTFHDAPKLVELGAFKFNAGNGRAIPGAVYDLYVVDPGPPTAPPTPPPDAVGFAGLTFEDRRTTDDNGQLTFVVRAGFSWCLRELYVPPGYVVDPALHCTNTISRTNLHVVNLPEATSTVRLAVHKFTAGSMAAGIPFAYYALFVRDPFPVGYAPPPVPSHLTVPPASTLWAIGYTDEAGRLVFTVPSGHEWCVREETAPAGFVLDPGLHCTGVLDADAATAPTTVAVAELAYTGAPGYLAVVSVALLAAGLALVRVGRRARRLGHYRDEDH
jgi:hypothetical protein